MAGAWGMFSNETIDLGGTVVKASEVLSVSEVRHTGGLFPDQDKLYVLGRRCSIDTNRCSYYGTRPAEEVIAEWKAWLAKSEVAAA